MCFFTRIIKNKYFNQKLQQKDVTFNVSFTLDPKSVLPTQSLGKHSLSQSSYILNTE